MSVLGKLKQKRRWAIASLASVPLIMTLGNSMLIPILPVMEQKLHITKLQSSYIISVYSIVAIFFIPLAGYLSDRFGRKKVLIPALILAGIGGMIAGFAAWKMENAFTVILLGRVLQGIGASGAMPIVLPFVGDLFQREKDASATLGVIETANTAGKVLSPILGAGLTAIIWFLPFFSITFFCLLSVLMVAFLIQSSEEKEEPIVFRTYMKEIKQAFQQHRRWLLAVFAIGAILMFILFGFLFYLSSVLEDDFDIKGIQKGLWLAAPLLALAVASYVTGKKIGSNLRVMKWVTFIGIVLTGLSVVIISFFDHFLYLLCLFFVCGAGIGMALPSLDALITKTFSDSIRGAITSIYSSMRFIGVAAGPPVIALFMKWHVFWIAGLFTIFALAAGMLAFRNIDPEAD